VRVVKPKFFGKARALPHKTTRHSLFAIRYSPFATRCRFGSAGISPSHFLPSRKVIHQSLIANCHSLFAIRYSLSFRLGRSLALQLSRLSLRLVFKSVSKKTKPAKAGWEKLEGASPDAPKIFRQCRSTALQKTCYSPFATRHSPSQKFSPAG